MTALRLILILIYTLSISGCEITAKQPYVHDFGLLPATDDITSENTPNINIDAPKWLWDTRIRYRLLFKSPTQVNFYMLDKWIATPPELFKQQLILRSKYLRYPVVIKLLDFEQQFESPKQAKVVVRFAITARSLDNKNILASKEFYLQRYSQTPDAKGAIEAFSYLINHAITDIDSWLADLPTT